MPFEDFPFVLSPQSRYNDDDFELVGTLENDVKDVDLETLSRRHDKLVEEKDLCQPLNLDIPMHDDDENQDSNQENEDLKVYTDLDRQPTHQYQPPQQPMPSTDEADPTTVQEMPEDDDSDSFAEFFPGYQKNMDSSQNAPGPSYQLGVYDQNPIASETRSAPDVGLQGTMAPVAPITYHFPAPSWYAQPQNTGSPQGSIVISLLNAAIWQYVNACVKEMTVTNEGQGIFPRLELHIGNLDPMAKYHVGVRLELVNDKKYCYDPKKSQWVEVNRRKPHKELAEPKTNEVFSEVQTGQDIMGKALKMNTVSIYTIGNEKRKTSSVMKARSEETVRKLEQEQEKRVRTMIRVFSQQKYIPVITARSDFKAREY